MESKGPRTEVKASEPKTEAPMNLQQLRKAAENNDLHLGVFFLRRKFKKQDNGWVGVGLGA